MHIYLVRHTEYLNPQNIYAFHLPLYLSEQGRKNALKIGSWFVDHNQSGIQIYSSPIVRAVQSAEIIASKTNSFVTVDKRLEETSCINLEGVKQPSEDSWKVQEDDESRETHEFILKRMLDVYQGIFEKGVDCLLVSHGDPITVLYYYLLKKDPPKYFWDPANTALVIQRGEIVDVEVSDDSINAINRIKIPEA